jgi:hypothetical protein
MRQSCQWRSSGCSQQIARAPQHNGLKSGGGRPRRVLISTWRLGCRPEITEDDLAERSTSLGVTAADILDRLIVVHLPRLAPLDTATGAAELADILDVWGLGSVMW